VTTAVPLNVDHEPGRNRPERRAVRFGRAVVHVERSTVAAFVPAVCGLDPWDGAIADAEAPADVTPAGEHVEIISTVEIITPTLAADTTSATHLVDRPVTNSPRARDVETGITPTRGPGIPQTRNIPGLGTRDAAETNRPSLGREAHRYEPAYSST